MSQGITPEEKAAVMQLMGQTYGQVNQQDQMIVGQSGNLRPDAHKMKQAFEQTAHMPTVNANPQHVQQPPPPERPQQVAPVTPEQAAQELAESPSPPTPVPAAVPVFDDEGPVQEDKNPNQMEFDLSEPKFADKLLDLMKEQNLILKGISLKLDNGKKTTRGHKQK